MVVLTDFTTRGNAVDAGGVNVICQLAAPGAVAPPHFHRKRTGCSCGIVRLLDHEVPCCASSVSWPDACDDGRASDASTAAALTNPNLIEVISLPSMAWYRASGPLAFTDKAQSFGKTGQSSRSDGKCPLLPALCAICKGDGLTERSAISPVKDRQE